MAAAKLFELKQAIAQQSQSTSELVTEAGDGITTEASVAILVSEVFSEIFYGTNLTTEAAADITTEAGTTIYTELQNGD